MKNLEHAALSLIDCAYDASETGEWAAVVGKIHEIVGGGSVSLDVHRTRHGLVTCDLFVSHGVEEKDAKSYVEEFAASNPLIKKIGSATPGVIRSVGELMEPDEFYKSDFARGYVIKNDFRETGGILFQNGPYLSSALSIWFRKQESDHTRFAQLFELIEPHLRRALRFNTIIADSRSTFDGLIATLDRTGRPICVVDVNMRVIYATPTFNTIIEEDYEIFVRNGLFTIRNSAIDTAFRSAVFMALSSRKDLTIKQNDQVNYFTIPRRNGRSPLAGC